MLIANKNRLRGSVAAASLLAMLGPSLADTVAPKPVFPSAPLPFELRQPTALRRLPAGRDDLMLRGENSSRRFSVYLSPDEVDAARVFQIAYTNSVTALPERSSLQVVVNGQALANIPLQATNAPANVQMPVPSGVLRAGFNSVEIRTAMAHRVDCSVAATYELWASLDPSATGFAVPTGPRAALNTVEDVAGEPLADDGTTHIRVRMAGGIDDAMVGRAAKLVNALVARAGLARPVVDVGSTAGSGPGLDVVIGTAGASDQALAGLAVKGSGDGLLFARDPKSQHLTVALTASDDDDLDARLAAFAGVAPRTADGIEHGVRIDGETRVTLANFGLDAATPTNRRSTTTLALDLPADFYPADYAKAQLLLHAAHATDLDADSGLTVRVNQATATSVTFPSRDNGEFQAEPVELPLHLFHPGHNEIEIDTVATAPGDHACDVLNAPNTPRFTLFNDSELVFPHFAHLGMSPQIASALAGPQAPSHPVAALYITDARDTSVAAGLTVLANMSVMSGRSAIPAIHVGVPAPTDTPGIVVGSWDTLPAALAAPLSVRLDGADRLRTPLTPSDANDATQGTPDIAGRLAAFLDAGQRGAGRWIDLASVREGVARLLRRQGFAFGGQKRDSAIPFTSRSLLVAAVEPQIDPGTVAGLEIPRFVAEPRRWLVVTASDAAVLGRGLERLVSDGRWSALQGEATSLDADEGTLASMQPTRVVYVVPQQLAVFELAPILSGLISTNIGLGLAALIALIALLGFSTHVLIRRSGVR